MMSEIRCKKEGTKAAGGEENIAVVIFMRLFSKQTQAKCWPSWDGQDAVKPLCRMSLLIVLHLGRLSRANCGGQIQRRTKDAGVTYNMG